MPTGNLNNNNDGNKYVKVFDTLVEFIQDVTKLQVIVGDLTSEVKELKSVLIEGDFKADRKSLIQRIGEVDTRIERINQCLKDSLKKCPNQKLMEQIKAIQELSSTSSQEIIALKNKMETLLSNNTNLSGLFGGQKDKLVNIDTALTDIQDRLSMIEEDIKNMDLSPAPLPEELDFWINLVRRYRSINHASSMLLKWIVAILIPIATFTILLLQFLGKIDVFNLFPSP